MVDSADAPVLSEGEALHRMLEAHRTFLENVYSLMRFLEAEITKHGWEIVRNGGYGVTRNGTGRGLTNFASGDWVVNQIAIAFAPSGSSKVSQGTTITSIPAGGLPLAVVQVRWLDKSPGQPAVWCARILVEPEGPKDPAKWEDYQSAILNRLLPEMQTQTAQGGDLRPGHLPWSGAGVGYSGTYMEIPLTDLRNEQDVMSQLVAPFLQRLSQAGA